MENFRRDHPGMPFAKVAQEAAKTYKKKQSGGQDAASPLFVRRPETDMPALKDIAPKPPRGGSKKSHTQSGGQTTNLAYSGVPPEGLGTSGVNLQINASTHGGSKRRSSNRRSSKRGSKKSHKRRSSKRH